MLKGKGRYDLPSDAGRKEISPQRGLIFYVGLSAALHLTVLATLAGPAFSRRAAVVEASAVVLSASLRATPAVLQPAPPALQPNWAATSAARSEEPREPESKRLSAAPGPDYFLSVEVDEPARPISLGRLIYPVEQLLNLVSGVVVVDLYISASGRLDRVRIVHSKPPEVFDAAALTALTDTEFRPAYRGGEPVPSVKRVEVNFDPRTEEGER